ncbi:MAG: triose-phosphate isomerase [Desulfobacterales bacterium]|nr:MAG: triose-phosphate isomerase [Desulfobacterales bacterium]
MLAERTPIVLSNWKMNKTVNQSLDYLANLMRETGSQGRRMEIILCVPFSLIKIMADKLDGPSLIAVSGQNVHWEDWGAYTGEISAPMLADLGAQFCMIGHSERRKYFAETDEMVNRKALALLKSGVRPIVCIGETREERQLELTINILEKQLRVCFNRFSASDLEQTVILYEPRWAIGTGNVANSDQIAEAHHYIRQELQRLFSPPSADRTRIIYGGSVTPDNIAAISKIEDVDGVGVGGASLDLPNFLKIVNAIPTP